MERGLSKERSWYRYSATRQIVQDLCTDAIFLRKRKKSLNQFIQVRSIQYDSEIFVTTNHTPTSVLYPVQNINL